MIVLIQQLIDISIIYFEFEKVLKIDIRRYDKDLTFPSITIGLTTFCDLNEGKFESVFQRKYIRNLKRKEWAKINEQFIDCIYWSNRTRKDFLQYPKLEEINSYLKGLVDENGFNLTIKSKPIRGLDLRNVPKWRTDKVNNFYF